MMKPMLHVSPHRQRRPSVHVSHTHQLMVVALVVRPHLPALAAALLAMALLLVLLVTTLLARQALANRVTRAKTMKARV